MVAVGWVEDRNPTVTRIMLGFAKLNPTYLNMRVPRKIWILASIATAESGFWWAAKPPTTINRGAHEPFSSFVSQPGWMLEADS
jgi:hypothetical protein